MYLQGTLQGILILCMISGPIPEQMALLGAEVLQELFSGVPGHWAQFCAYQNKMYFIQVALGLGS